MKYKDKNALPSLLQDVINIIEQYQNSEFIEAYRDFNDGWLITFRTEFHNLGGFSSVEDYLEQQFNVFLDNNSYFEELCMEDNQQIIYLKDDSTFEL